MYVMISLLTLVVALTFNVCFGSRLQSHYQLLGMTVSELVFLLCFLGGACALILFARKHPLERDETLDLYEISSLRPAKLRHLAGGLLLIAGGYLGTTLYFHILALLFPEAIQAASDSMLVVLYSENLPLMLLGTALIPAICEELLFRGLIHYSFTRQASARYAVIATALLFAGFHLSPIRFPSTFASGLLLGYALHRSGSILVPMLMHLASNAVSALVSFHAPPVMLDGTAGVILLGTGTLLLLGLGCALLEEHPRAALSRHPVTVLATVGIILLLTVLPIVL